MFVPLKPFITYDLSTHLGRPLRLKSSRCLDMRLCRKARSLRFTSVVMSLCLDCLLTLTRGTRSICSTPKPPLLQAVSPNEVLDLISRFLQSLIYQQHLASWKEYSKSTLSYGSHPPRACTARDHLTAQEYQQLCDASSKKSSSIFAPETFTKTNSSILAPDTWNPPLYRALRRQAAQHHNRLCQNLVC